VRLTVKLETLYLAFAIPLIILIMAFSSLFSTVPILIFYALCGGLLLFQRIHLHLYVSDIISLLLPVYATASLLWSDAPGTTQRAGIQFITMVGCALIIARHVPFERFLPYATLGAFLVLVINLADGTYGFDAMTRDYALVGLMGSKNQVGFWAEIGLLFLLAYFLTLSSARLRYLVVAPAGLFLLYCLWLSDSKSSMLSLGAVLGLVGLARLARLIKRPHRRMFFWAMALISAVCATAFFAAGMHLLVLDMLGKDPTLTGRTTLWLEGLQVGHQHPILGNGYSAFWVQGHYAAEALWHTFHIPTRSGFHFHNLLIQTYADLGLVGVILITGLLLACCLRATHLFLDRPHDLRAMVLFMLAYMFLTRTMVEVDLLGPYGVGPLLFFILFTELFGKPSVRATTSHQRRDRLAHDHDIVP